MEFSGLSMNDLLKNLNPAQLEAVTWPKDKPLLIVAGAGSGKTRILTHRIAWLIGQGVPAYSILGVTFTNKAAKEMQSRIERLVSQRVWISTFHSTCLKILRMDGAAIGIDPLFTILDEQDQLSNIKECLAALQMNEKQVHPKAVRERIQRAKDYVIGPAQYRADAQEYFEEQVAKVYALYEQRLEKQKALDFGDLIMRTVLLFQQAPQVLEAWRSRFRTVLIDEYQDTNHAQYKLIHLIASATNQITAVGDPDQSIYSWRGADIQNILRFEHDYPGAGHIRMEQNYRSSPVILDSANTLIRNNVNRKPKELWTERKDNDPIEVYQASDEMDEAQFVAGRVLGYRREGIELAHQVIFYRTHAQSRAIEDVLMKMNIPYKIVGGVRFYDRKEIKDIVAYLKVIANAADETSLKRIINVPARGISKKTVEEIEELARISNVTWDAALRRVNSIPDLMPKAKKSVTSLVYWLDSMRSKHQLITLRALVEKMLQDTGYLSALEAEKTSESLARIENIEEFFSVIDHFEESYLASGGASELDKNMPMNNPAEQKELLPPPSKLHAFLEQISLVTDLDKWEAGTNALTMMTLHTAKGLEFPVVYMVGLEEGIFPHNNSMGADTEELEEERRLCYVGMTRAEKKLHMSFANCRRLFGSIQHNLPSRFLTEVPTEHIHSVSGIRQTYGSKSSSFRDELVAEDIFDDLQIPDFDS